jgi:hypothetical protein
MEIFLDIVASVCKIGAFILASIAMNTTSRRLWGLNAMLALLAVLFFIRIDFRHLGILDILLFPAILYWGFVCIRNFFRRLQSKEETY